MKLEFINALRNTVSTISVVTTNSTGEVAGATVSSFCSVSADPPTLLVCIFKDTPLTSAIKKNKKFCINLLSQSQINVSDIFAGREISPSKNRFDLVEWKEGNFNQPILTGSVASFECNLTKTVDGFTHDVFFGNVLSVFDDQKIIEPLLYCKQQYAKSSIIDNSHIGLNKLMLELL
jgi:flavin reductase (DIM6/NTAB) family NADH-FMN oxidoreductase RutF